MEYFKYAAIFGPLFMVTAQANPQGTLWLLLFMVVAQLTPRK